MSELLQWALLFWAVVLVLVLFELRRIRANFDALIDRPWKGVDNPASPADQG